MISQVTIKVTNNGQSREIWFLFESDHLNLYELNETLAEDGTVYGQRIETEGVGPGRRRELRRYEYIVHRDTIVSISPTQYDLLAPEASAGAQ